MAKIEVYEIEVLGWDEHKGGLKKNHPYFPVSKRIFDNDKVATLTSLERLLYVIILGRCADDYAANIRPTRHQLLTALGQTRYDIATALMSLQRNQLVKLSNLPSNRIEKKRKEKNRTSAGVQEPAAAAVTTLVPHPNSGANKRVWESYRDAYLNRYGVEPVRNAKVNSNIAQLSARIGADDAPEVVKFYVAHNDSFYVRNMHAIGFCLRDCESLRTQWLKGRAITGNDVRRFEKQQEQVEILAAIERGEV